MGCQRDVESNTEAYGKNRTVSDLILKRDRDNNVGFSESYVDC